MRFHCASNPNFSLRTPRLSIRFTDGHYETEDKEEIRLLQREDVVTEAPSEPDLRGRVIPVEGDPRDYEPEEVTEE